MKEILKKQWRLALAGRLMEEESLLIVKEDALERNGFQGGLAEVRVIAGEIVRLSGKSER
jgi:hypothetical protein